MNPQKTNLELMRDQMHTLIDQFFDEWNTRLSPKKAANSSAITAQPKSQPSDTLYASSLGNPIPTVELPQADPRLEEFFRSMQRSYSR